MILRALVAVALAASLAVAGTLHESTQWVMGSPLRIISPEPVAPDVANAAVAEAHALESLLSTWRDDTPLARFNAAPAGPDTVPDALRTYLERARRDHARTRGAFDPSVGTLRVDPDAPIGMHRLRFVGSAVVRPHAAFAVDPGGDGKGLAVDAIDAHLRDAGVTDFLVDFGGSSWIARGRGEDAAPWRVALAHGTTPIGTMILEDRALSVSSTVRFDRGPDGETTAVHHLVDPRTRTTVVADRTVAVLAATALEAEVVSTALAVDGIERADWLEVFDAVEVLVVEDGAVVVSGPSFRPVDPAE